MAMTAWAAKFCKQSDLPVGERPDLAAPDDEGAEQRSFLAQAPRTNCVRAPPSSTIARRPGLPRIIGTATAYRGCAQLSRPRNAAHAGFGMRRDQVARKLCHARKAA